MSMPASFIPQIAKDFGVIFPGARDWSDSAAAMDEANKLLAYDAAPTNLLQSGIITNPNAGVMAFLANFQDPEVTRVLTTPPEAAELIGETKKGTWELGSTTFPIIEHTGEVTAYGDYNTSGLTGANVNFEPRQLHRFQTYTRWGDLELAEAGLAKLDWAAEQNLSSATVITKAINRIYCFGVANLDNYGLLNDPLLSAYLAPANGAWSAATGTQIFLDIQNLYVQLQRQLNGNIGMKDRMILGMSPLLVARLLTPMSLVTGVTNVEDMIKRSFPKLEIKTMVEYTTTAGEVVQLIAPVVKGQKAGYCAFAEKMRAHPVVREDSATHQKKSACAWGAIYRIPAAVAQGIGY